MSHINFHPAIGLGELMDGWFVVPQNPIRDAGTPLVPSVQATRPNQVMRKPRLADLMPGMFTLPQNPIRTALSGGGMGCAGMGCGGGQPQYGMNGMGSLDLSSMTDWLTGPSFVSNSIPNWALFGAGAVALWFITQPSGSEYRAKRRALRSQYAGYKRAARSTGSAISSVGNPRRHRRRVR